jgi:hypothetical protein
MSDPVFIVVYLMDPPGRDRPLAEDQCVSEQPADPLPAREETTHFVVKSNQELCVCWYDCIMDQIDVLLDSGLR